MDWTLRASSWRWWYPVCACYSIPETWSGLQSWRWSADDSLYDCNLGCGLDYVDYLRAYGSWTPRVLVPEHGCLDSKPLVPVIWMDDAPPLHHATVCCSTACACGHALLSFRVSLMASDELASWRGLVHVALMASDARLTQRVFDWAWPEHADGHRSPVQ